MARLPKQRVLYVDMLAPGVSCQSLSCEQSIAPSRAAKALRTAGSTSYLRSGNWSARCQRKWQRPDWKSQAPHSLWLIARS